MAALTVTACGSGDDEGGGDDTGSNGGGGAIDCAPYEAFGELEGKR